MLASSAALTSHTRLRDVRRRERCQCRHCLAVTTLIVTMCGTLRVSVAEAPSVTLQTLFCVLSLTAKRTHSFARTGTLNSSLGVEPIWGNRQRVDADGG